MELRLALAVSALLTAATLAGFFANALRGRLRRPA